MDTPLIEKFAEIMVNAQRLVVTTGAGMSRESGVPTFRDALDGLWAKYDPTELATPSAFKQNPKLVWDWYMFRREMIASKEPNPGHYALAELEDLLPQVIVVTQNIDGFHQIAGSRDVICLHGDITRDKCFGDCQGVPTYVDRSTVQGWDSEAGPPTCPHCQKEYLRPAVVWYNEALPQHELSRAMQISSQSDVMLVVGTSGVVYPAAHVPIIAKQAGATTLEINPNPSQLTALMDHYLPAPSGEALPKMVAKIRELVSS